MIRLEGFHKHCITLEAGEGVAAGQLVTITGDDTAATATSGGFAGLALAVRNGKALVQVTGYMKVPHGQRRADQGGLWLRPDCRCRRREGGYRGKRRHRAGRCWWPKRTARTRWQASFCCNRKEGNR